MASAVQKILQGLAALFRPHHAREHFAHLHRVAWLQLGRDPLYYTFELALDGWKRQDEEQNLLYLAT